MRDTGRQPRGEARSGLFRERRRGAGAGGAGAPGKHPVWGRGLRPARELARPPPPAAPEPLLPALRAPGVGPAPWIEAGVSGAAGFALVAALGGEERPGRFEAIEEVEWREQGGRWGGEKVAGGRAPGAKSRRSAMCTGASCCLPTQDMWIPPDLGLSRSCV